MPPKHKKRAKTSDEKAGKPSKRKVNPHKGGKKITLSEFHRQRTAAKLTSLKERMQPDLDFEKITMLDKKYCLVNEADPELKKKYQPVSDGVVSFMNPTIVYSFLLKGITTYTSGGTGISTGYIAFDPSVYGFSEWTTLVSLFTEFRLIEATMTIVGYKNIPTSYYSYGPFAIGYDISTASAPASMSDVINLQSGKLFNPILHNGLGYTMVCRPSPKLNWSLTSAPSNTPYAGSPGCFQLYGINMGNTVPVATIVVANLYEFRARQ